MPYGFNSTVYGDQLYNNQQNYNNILSAYGQGQQNLSGSLSGIYSGYSDLGGQVASTLGYGGTPWGVAAPAAQAIGQTFKEQQGQTTQQMINAGLGNTTVLGNLQNQNARMAGQAYGGLGAQLAQTYAGYQSQIGMAGLGARMQGLGAQTGLTTALMGNLASQRNMGGYGGGGGGGNPSLPGGILGGGGGIGSQFGQPMMQGGQAWGGGDPNANLNQQMGIYSTQMSDSGGYGGGYDTGGGLVDYGGGGDFVGGGDFGGYSPDFGGGGDF